MDSLAALRLDSSNDKDGFIKNSALLPTGTGSANAGTGTSSIGGSASGDLLRQRKEQQLREQDITSFSLPSTVTEKISHYHSQIISSTVEEPRRQSRKGKHNRKVEKGVNYQSKLSTKFDAKTRRQELFKSIIAK